MTEQTKITIYFHSQIYSIEGLSKSQNLDNSIGTTPDRGPPVQFKNTSSKNDSEKKSGLRKSKADDTSFIKRKRLKQESKNEKNAGRVGKLVKQLK